MMTFLDMSPADDDGDLFPAQLTRRPTEAQDIITARNLRDFGGSDD